MTLRAFLAGCWFSHSKETHWTGTVLQCQRCWEAIPILATAAKAGDRHQPEPVRGVPMIKAKKQFPEKVLEFTRESQR